MKVDGIVATKA